MSDDTIENLAHQLGATFENKSERYSSVTRILKWGLVFGSSVITCMHFIPEQKWEPSAYIGIISTIIVLIAAAFLVYLDEDAFKEIEIARKSVEKAREMEKKCQQVLSEYDTIQKAQIMRNELYLSMMSIKDIIESSIKVNSSSEESIAELFLAQPSRSLRLACGFAAQDHHTISIYRARSSKRGAPHQKELYLIATDRSIPCPLASARSFPAGVGATGIAYSKNTIVFNEDSNVSSVVDLPEGYGRTTDVNLHASIVAVPIRVGGVGAPWGVVTLTCSVPNHFQRQEKGLQAAEPARAVAGMMALAVNALAMRHADA